MIIKGVFNSSNQIGLFCIFVQYFLEFEKYENGEVNWILKIRLCNIPYLYYIIQNLFI